MIIDVDVRLCVCMPASACAYVCVGGQAYNVV